MDNHVMFNIIRQSDQVTAVNILKASGKDMFKAIWDMNYCQKVDWDVTKNSLFDIYFSITDTPNEYNIIERIKIAFNNKASILKIPKTYSMAVQSTHHQYLLICQHTPVFLEGLSYMSVLVKDQVIHLLDDIRLEVPKNFRYNDCIIILNIANIFNIHIKKIDYEMFYLDFDMLVKKFNQLFLCYT